MGNISMVKASAQGDILLSEDLIDHSQRGLPQGPCVIIDLNRLALWIRGLDAHL